MADFVSSIAVAGLELNIIDITGDSQFKAISLGINRMLSPTQTIANPETLRKIAAAKLEEDGGKILGRNLSKVLSNYPGPGGPFANWHDYVEAMKGSGMHGDRYTLQAIVDKLDIYVEVYGNDGAPELYRSPYFEMLAREEIKDSDGYGLCIALHHENGGDAEIYKNGHYDSLLPSQKPVRLLQHRNRSYYVDVDRDDVRAAPLLNDLRNRVNIAKGDLVAIQEEALKEDRLAYERSPGDGNCQFHSLANQLNQRLLPSLSFEHSQIREIAVKEISLSIAQPDRRQYYGSILVNQILAMDTMDQSEEENKMTNPYRAAGYTFDPDHPYGPDTLNTLLEKYVNDMKRDKCWGDAVTISGFANAFKLCGLIYTTDRNPNRTTTSGKTLFKPDVLPDDYGDREVCLIITALDAVHFNSTKALDLTEEYCYVLDIEALRQRQENVVTLITRDDPDYTALIGRFKARVNAAVELAATRELPESPAALDVAAPAVAVAGPAAPAGPAAGPAGPTAPAAEMAAIGVDELPQEVRDILERFDEYIREHYLVFAASRARVEALLRQQSPSVALRRIIVSQQVLEDVVRALEDALLLNVDPTEESIRLVDERSRNLSELMRSDNLRIHEGLRDWPAGETILIVGQYRRTPSRYETVIAAIAQACAQALDAQFDREQWLLRLGECHGGVTLRFAFAELVPTEPNLRESQSPTVSIAPDGGAPQNAVAASILYLRAQIALMIARNVRISAVILTVDEASSAFFNLSPADAGVDFRIPERNLRTVAQLRQCFSYLDNLSPLGKLIIFGIPYPPSLVGGIGFVPRMGVDIAWEAYTQTRPTGYGTRSSMQFPGVVEAILTAIYVGGGAGAAMVNFASVVLFAAHRHAIAVGDDGELRKSLWRNFHTTIRTAVSPDGGPFVTNFLVAIGTMEGVASALNLQAFDQDRAVLDPERFQTLENVISRVNTVARAANVRTAAVVDQVILDRIAIMRAIVNLEQVAPFAHATLRRLGLLDPENLEEGEYIFENPI